MGRRRRGQAGAKGSKQTAQGPGGGAGASSESLSRMVSANVCWVGWGSGAGGGGEGGPGLAASPTRCARSGHPDHRGLALLLPGSWRVSWGGRQRGQRAWCRVRGRGEGLVAQTLLRMEVSARRVWRLRGRGTSLAEVAGGRSGVKAGAQKGCPAHSRVTAAAA